MNQTKNQHFISQIEQRLNTCNQNATNANQRIYEFEIVDRDKHVLRLTNTYGNLIKNNLSMLDLFSFDVDHDKNTKLNFEHVFQNYEEQLYTNTKSILLAHAKGSRDIGAELINLFTAKLVNFMRNPYSITKVINTFGTIATYDPANPEIYNTYTRILTGRQPHQTHICHKLGITDDQYKIWLRLMFMLLTPMVEGIDNFFEETVKGMFTTNKHAIIIHIHKYTEQRCLLSDRGFSSPINDQGENLVFDFNLCTNAFIRFAWLDYQTILKQAMPDSVRNGLAMGPTPVHVSYLTNDLLALDAFHRRVIEQCYEKVYCSGKTAYSANILK